MSALAERTLDQLVIEDERSFRHVGLYADLKQVLLQSKYTFRILPKSDAERWDEALFLNLTYWKPGEGDVLVAEEIPADVVAHVAWHHLAARASDVLSADALLFGESIASAFDLYLVGRLLGHSPNSTFLETQVSAMADCALAAGLPDAEFEALLESIGDDPDRAFEDLRELLFDATTALVACATVDEARAALDRLASHRFATLLHHYELSNWVLSVRAHGGPVVDPKIRAIDAELRRAPVALDWLTAAWLRD